MTAFEDALYICTLLTMILILPWSIICFPALAQSYMGNPEPAAILVAQGYHLTGYGIILLILCILSVGVWIDQ